MARDPLAPLHALNGVSDALSGARAAVDAMYQQPALRRQGGKAGPELALRAAVASAALQGRAYDLAEVRAGTGRADRWAAAPRTDPVLQGALRCAEALPGLVEGWRRTPRQVLARLHLLAARGTVDDAALGRPVAGVVARLDALVDVVLVTAEPGLLRAAVVHGELLALRAFPGPYGVVARAAARLELMGSGFDPRGWSLVEAGHLAREPEYVGSAGAFATGTPDGVRAWLRHCATAVELGAAAAVSAVD